MKEADKGTPQSHEILSITAKKPFKGQFIKYPDGTDMRNITLLDKEAGLQRITGGEFQKADEKTTRLILFYQVVPLQ